MIRIMKRLPNCMNLFLSIYPENSNLSAKLGICYLNLDGKKADALKLLSKASLNVVSNDKEYLNMEKKHLWIPIFIWLLHIIRMIVFKKQYTLYNDAKKRLSGTKIFRDEYIDNQIRDCRYAMEMKKKPLTLISNLFTPWLS